MALSTTALVSPQDQLETSFSSSFISNQPVCFAIVLKYQPF